ncbi:MAG: hypothetical protein Q7U56_09105 [Humidesulfovibrio sp.]|nr:hypothetical protein [Humidesulfovibrio sp.]
MIKLESKSRLDEFYRQACRKTAYTPVRDFRALKVGQGTLTDQNVSLWGGRPCVIVV